MVLGTGSIASGGGGPFEAVWRLVFRAQMSEGRYALRRRIFVELVEDA